MAEQYTLKSEVYASLVNLHVDIHICRRNGKKKLVWIAVRGEALRYEVRIGEMLLKVRRRFAGNSCPVNGLFGKFGITCPSTVIVA